jgi:hypothetical protein
MRIRGRAPGIRRGDDRLPQRAGEDARSPRRLLARPLIAPVRCTKPHLSGCQRASRRAPGPSPGRHDRCRKELPGGKGNTVERCRMEPQQPGGRVLAARRADTGSVRLGERDITGLVLCAEHYGAPYDLLAAALDVRPDRLRGIVARWRKAGYASTGTLGPGPAWCWLTPAGMAVTGLTFPATRPALARLAHIRAVLAVRLWLQDGEAYQAGRAWWRSERRIRAAAGRGVGIAHVPDAEIHWPAWTPPRTPGRCGRSRPS